MAGTFVLVHTTHAFAAGGPNLELFGVYSHAHGKIDDLVHSGIESDNCSGGALGREHGHAPGQKVQTAPRHCHPQSGIDGLGSCSGQ